MKKIGIVGLGLIGKERLNAISLLQKKNLAVSTAALFDPHIQDLETLATQNNAIACSELDDIINLKLDLVIVATPHDTSIQITQKLLSAGTKVLLEKPMGRNLQEAAQLVENCLRPDQLYIGQNYRFFPGVTALIKDIQAEHFGKPIGFSLVLGHGGSPQDRQSWKLDKERAGGGVLIDPGIHLIDLCRLIDGKLEFIAGTKWSGFWQTGIEEECRLLMRSQNIPAIDMTISIVRWLSTFRLEFFGEDGYGIVQGRGRSYGMQQYRRGQRWGWQSGKTQIDSEEIVLNSSCDQSFANELEAIFFPTTNNSLHPATASESLENMTILETIRSALKLT